MNGKSHSRRNFIKATASAAIGMSLISNPLLSGKNQRFPANNKRVGIIWERAREEARKQRSSDYEIGT